MALNDDANVLSLRFESGGIEVTVEFPGDTRKNLGRLHTFFVGYEHEEYGQQAKDLLTAATELAEEVESGYARQPRLHDDDTP